MNNVYETLKDWKRRNRLRKKDANLLLEAYRRFHAFARRDRISLSDARLGYGMGEYDQSPFFSVLFGNRPPRCRGWYALTDAGKKVLSDLNAHLPWKPNYSEDIFTGSFSV